VASPVIVEDEWSLGDLQELASFRPTETCGIVSRSLYRIFDATTRDSAKYEYRVMVSFLQLYMERITDLLAPEKDNLHIREDPKTGVYVENLSQVIATSPAEVLYLISEGVRNRATSSTLMNQTSSRSHVILRVTVEHSLRQQKTEKPAAKPPSVKRGLLTIIDLAGSERVSKSGSEGVRLEEAKTINKSICALGNVIASLADPAASYVSFRDSKLTRLLTHSLSGNCLTSICATLNPLSLHFDESFSTALFASRAMAVNTKACINESEHFLVPDGTGIDENNVMDAGAKFLSAGARARAKGKARKGLNSLNANKQKTGWNNSTKTKGGARQAREGNSYSLIYCFQKALQKAQGEVEVLKADMETKDRILMEAETAAKLVADVSEESTEAQRQAEGAVVQLSKALLLSREAMKAKESLCEARLEEMRAQMKAREAEYQAQIQNLEKDVDSLNEKLKAKESMDQYRILI